MDELSDKLRESDRLLSEDTLRIACDLLTLQSRILGDVQDAHCRGVPHQALALTKIWFIFLSGLDSLVEGLVMLYASERDKS